MGWSESEKNLQWGGLVEDDYHKFAKSASDLYYNESLWINAQQEGWRVLQTLFSSKRATNFVDTIVEQSQQVRERRKNDFVQAMLCHSSNKSNEYFSKFIATKNELQLLKKVTHK